MSHVLNRVPAVERNRLAELILFHHVQGLTPGVEDFAEQLRAAGHNVAVPDLFGGRTFSSIEEGFAFSQELGSRVDTTALAATEEMPADVVFAGFSMGAMLAHEFAQTRPGAKGALLYHHGDVPIDTFGESWPEGVDLQIHVSEGDEFYEAPVVTEFVEKAGQNANTEVFIYPGSSHLFIDSSLDAYEEDSAALVLERTLEFLSRIS